jgi:hypothetical protein
MAAARALAAGMALLVFFPGASLAQQPARDAAALQAPGMVTARAFRMPADGFTVFVSPYDDSDLHLTLKADIESRLAASGRAHLAEEKAAGYLLFFDSAVVPAEQAPQRPSLGSVRADQGGAEVNVNVWSSTQDSVLGGRQTAQEVGSSVFHMHATLRDRASGEVVWQGDAYYVLGEPETERVARALVAPLVERMGESVVREAIEID